MVTIRISNDENGNLTYSLLIAETSRFSCSTILSVTMSLTAAGAISEHTVPSEKTLSTSDRSFDSKGNEEGVLSDERDIATNVISVDDDASLNPWTIRAFFIGLGLSAFGGVLAEIYYFKPQTVTVSLMFLAVVSYILGVSMETFIPRRGLLRYLNPGPFNKKENAFIIIMASASAKSALGTEVLAVQRVPTLLFSTSWLWNWWYDEKHPVISIKDVIPRCATIAVHVRCALRGRDGSTEEAQNLLHGVCCYIFLGAFPRMDISASDRLFNFLPCSS